jgi:hypothetical protein
MSKKRFGRRSTVGLVALVALAAMALIAFVGGAGAVVAGAGYTTTNSNYDGAGTCFNGPGVVNCNIYQAKENVWINGGPTNGTSALSDGTYFFVVGVPGGENSDINDAAAVPDTTAATAKNLSDDFDAYTNRTFTVVNHHIATSTGTHVFDSGKIRLFPYSDTTNSGGEYFVGICKYTPDDPATTDVNESTYPVDPADCKYDNFKVNQTICVGETCTPTPFGVVSGEKYYDANANGQLDAGEAGIANWPIDFTDGVTPNSQLTGTDGTFSLNLSPAGYTFQEELPNTPTTWTQTGNTVDQTHSTGTGESASLTNKIYSVTVVDGGTTTGLNFGNLCVGAGGGLTLGFYSNKNGQATVTAADLTFLTSLNLVNANGSPFDPASAKTLATWLVNATATNMAYMLSAQLATMELNVRHGAVSGSALIYAPGTTSANANGFATVSDVMAEGNTLLGSTGGNLTVAASTLRTHEEAVKTALDRGNNNLNFVQPDAGHCPTPIFP